MNDNTMVDQILPSNTLKLIRGAAFKVPGKCLALLDDQYNIDPEFIFNKQTSSANTDYWRQFPVGSSRSTHLGFG